MIKRIWNNLTTLGAYRWKISNIKSIGTIIKLGIICTQPAFSLSTSTRSWELRLKIWRAFLLENRGKSLQRELNRCIRKLTWNIPLEIRDIPSVIRITITVAACLCLISGCNSAWRKLTELRAPDTNNLRHSRKTTLTLVNYIKLVRHLIIKTPALSWIPKTVKMGLH